MQNKQIDSGNINRSGTHGCGNWNCGHAIPFLGICVSNFQHWYFALCKKIACENTDKNFTLNVFVIVLFDR